MSYKALLFCPEDKTARVVTQVLTDLDFRVEPCNETFGAVKRLMAEHFDAIVVDCDNEQNAALLFKSAHNSGSNQKSLAVAVVEGQAGVAKAFRIGANLVLTKPINVEQSKGTLRVARGLLRKTEFPKSASADTSGSPSTTVSPVAPVRSVVSEVPIPKTKITSSPVQPPAIPPAASAMFEVEQEPAPKPEPTEAALLESMPDPLADAKLTPPAPIASKEYPWQPISKPMSEPMATALRHAAEVAGEPEVKTEPAAPASSVPSVASNLFTSTPTFGTGAASAPAPAREAPEFVSHESVHQPEAPLFSAVTGGKDAATDFGGSKKGVAIAAVVLIAAAAGYFGWTKLHSRSEVASSAAPKAAQVQPQLAPPQTASTPSNLEPAANAPAQTQPAASAPVEQGPDITLSSSKPVPSAPKPSAEPPKQTSSAKSSTSQTQPLLVKGGSVAHPAPPPSAPETPAPAMLALGSSSADQGISGIVSAPTSSIAQPAPQTLKVSQGVAQGLLMKRVPPAYPQQAKQARIQGTVELLASIDKDGSISAVKVLSGDKTLALAASNAVKQWKYKPYLLDGQPVEIQTQITVNFKLPQ